MAKKGRKSTKGQPDIYEEVKGLVSLSLTPTGVKGLDGLAVEAGLSRSELVEQIGRGLIPMAESRHSLNQEDKAHLGKH